MGITEMYDKNITTSGRIDGEESEEFEVKIGVHQGLVLSPFLFAIGMDEITKNVREGGVKELLCADDVVLLGDSCEEAEMSRVAYRYQKM